MYCTNEILRLRYSFINCRFPLMVKQMCTPRKALIVACLLPSIATLKNFHLFFTRGRQFIGDPEVPPEEWEVKNCGFPTPQIEFFETYIRSWIAFSLHAFIPILIVFVLNILIIKTLYKTRKVNTINITVRAAGAKPVGGNQKSTAREERAKKSNEN